MFNVVAMSEYYKYYFSIAMKHMLVIIMNRLHVAMFVHPHTDCIPLLALSSTRKLDRIKYECTTVPPMYIKIYTNGNSRKAEKAMPRLRARIEFV